MDEMHLTEVRLGGIARDSRAVLNGAPLVRIALDAEPLQETNAVLTVLADAVIGRAVHRNDDTSFPDVHATERIAGGRTITTCPVGSIAWSSPGNDAW